MIKNSILKTITSLFGVCKDCGCVLGLGIVKYHKEWHKLNGHISVDGKADKIDWMYELTRGRR